ncbi:MAG: type 1 glutamine amidotransferase [Acidobacteriota bacterium]|nr:type 1 glutamine amidotransferase [Acidobacteriota bacterium]
MLEPDSGAPRSILVLRHEPFEHLGFFADILNGLRIPFVFRDLNDKLDLGLHQGLIIMGGPPSANDPEMSAEMHFIQQVIGNNYPVLGVCLGAQLIAKALGAHVYRNREKEIGWAPVHFTESAQSDPVLGGLDSPSVFFHWHSETFTQPPGSDLLAYSDKCRQQAFRYRDHVYGIQFHPEITPAMIADWSAQPLNCGDVDTLEAPIDPHGAATAPMARHILEGWLGLFQKAS